MIPHGGVPRDRERGEGIKEREGEA